MENEEAIRRIAAWVVASDNIPEEVIDALDLAVESLSNSNPAQEEKLFSGEWIDAQGQSPEKPGRYLVVLRRYAPESLGGNQCKVTILRFRPDGNFQYPVHFPDWINDEIEETITHWMPLPDLPEKEIQPIWFMENGATFPQTMREEKTGTEWWVRTPHPIFDRVPGLKEVCTLRDICDGFSSGKFYECCHYCNHFSTDGLTSPNGWCDLHPEEGSGFAETYGCPKFEMRYDQ